jgi:hypothetical protein
MNLSQNQISQKIFTFNKELNGLKPGESYTEIQDAIFGAPNMAGIARENLPSFMYFQIKKGVNKMENTEE